MDSSNCGKVCLITCLTCAGLIVLFVIIMVILTCAGCTIVSSMFPGLFKSVGQIIKIQGYFDDLETQGWEVDDSQSGQPSGYGGNVEAGAPMIWRAREHPDDEWIMYVWELRPADPEAWERMEEEGQMPSFTTLMNWMLIPRTEAALEVHEELELPLPDDFELEPWEEGGVEGKDHERGEEEEDGDRVRDRDTGDEDEEGEEEEEGETGREHRGKSFRKAA